MDAMVTDMLRLASFAAAMMLPLLVHAGSNIARPLRPRPLTVTTAICTASHARHRNPEGSGRAARPH
ncbi:hypothetical protein [Cognatazoarcus halotolerans]|uniref:hypothetical protein n=1 Tax=Cognatazoarcus halotolerans TaxID=2686016 RepID=UPI00135BC7A4|nr:hypothetical protein [Cognatazoarcus halotolerans]MBX3679952.1 hypothetical protein [Rhodocyclaceae bacterium]MCB1899178.1 hypothetical protein [Rhodocyclaceae bacterium]MCP5308404.1 hypothetical protein [Zoogloeaceae bacterium]